MEHYKSRNNDYFHFTNPHDDASDLDDEVYDESQYYDVDDDLSCDSSFHINHPIGINRSTPADLQTISLMNQIDAVKLRDFDNGALIFQLDNSMKNISDKLQHTIEGIGSQISHLEDETCKLDNFVQDVKNCEERYHGTTHRNLRQMQSILQEVQDGVLFLRDKHEIAETQLQLAILHGSVRDKMNISSKSSCNTPFLNQQSNESTFSQHVSYHPVLHQDHEITAQQYIFSPNLQSHIPSDKKSYLQIPHFASFSNIRLHDEPSSSSYEISNMKPVESFLHSQEESSRSNYNYNNTHVAQTLPHALPTAIDVNQESKSESELNRNTIPVDDIVDKVTGMGFRRDLVRACVRKLAVNGSQIDLNSVLDNMMNNK